MQFHPASADNAEHIAALVAREDPKHGLPKNQPAAIAACIRTDIGTPSGQSHWLITQAGEAAAHIAVLPPPPIYDLKGGLAGIVLGLWRTTTDAAVALQTAEAHLCERRAAMLIVAFPAHNAELRQALEARGYRATTDYMAKLGLTAAAHPEHVRLANEADIPTLVAFNREGRQRLHEANPAFWTSHPDAEARFGFWMKISLTMRDRAIFVSERDGRPTGFVIAQPPSPIQVPIALDETQIGVIDDFHCTTFGSSLDRRQDDDPARALLQAAESDFVRRGKTGAIAICPVAWPAKAALLESCGYKTHHTWFTRLV